MALLAQEVDLAVHSAKDLPGEETKGLNIVAVPTRDDARDVYVGNASSIDDIPKGSRIGTSSLRRKAQLLASRPDLEIRELRGNIDTRLRMHSAGDFDGIVLAAAGMNRINVNDQPGFALTVEELVPAPGQGALALQARAGDAETQRLVEKIGDRRSWACLQAERTIVGELNATCSTPLGVYADFNREELVISTFIGQENGNRWIRDRVSGSPDDPLSLGKSCAQRLLGAGAEEILQTTRDEGAAET